MRKYTVTAERELPSRLWRPRRMSTSRRAALRGRLCQQQTHVLAEQFGITEHDGFRGPYLSGNTPEAVFHGQGRSTVQQDVLRGATLISERTREAPLPWAPDDRSPQRTRRTGREPGRGTRHRTLARLPRCDQVLRGGAWG